jgi:hypothetical protein
MFHGTTIDDLLNIVERAEEHAHTVEVKTKHADDMMFPAFLADMATTTQDWVGAF